MFRRSCPKCGASVNLMAPDHMGEGEAHYRCASCQSRLRTMAKGRRLPATTIAVVVSLALFSFLPPWVAAPLSLIPLIALLRHISALRVAD
jgi:hypothetical protein